MIIEILDLIQSIKEAKRIKAETKMMELEAKKRLEEEKIRHAKRMQEIREQGQKEIEESHKKHLQEMEELKKRLSKMLEDSGIEVPDDIWDRRN